MVLFCLGKVKSCAGPGPANLGKIKKDVAVLVGFEILKEKSTYVTIVQIITIYHGLTVIVTA